MAFRSIAMSIIDRIEALSPQSRAIVLAVVPAETAAFHVLGTLLRQDQHERDFLGERDQPGLVVELSGGLRAAMKGDDQRQSVPETGGPVDEHLKRAGIVAEL